MHDIGKLSTPDRILFKPGSLTEEEWEVMRLHTLVGEQICRPMKALAPVLPIIRNHHEKWDGTGYPDGLAGKEIPLLARVLQFADVYDALTTTRPYKRAFSSDEALELIRKETDRGWRDPSMMPVFFNLIARTKDAPLVGWEDIESMQTSLENMRQHVSLPARNGIARPETAPAPAA